MKKSSLIILYLIWFVGFVVANTVVHTTRYRFLEIDYGPKYNRKFSNNLIDLIDLIDCGTFRILFFIFMFSPSYRAIQTLVLSHVVLYSYVMLQNILFWFFGYMFELSLFIVWFQFLIFKTWIFMYYVHRQHHQQRKMGTSYFYFLLNGQFI